MRAFIASLLIACTVQAQQQAAAPPPMSVHSSAGTLRLETLGRRMRDLLQAPDGAIYAIVDAKAGDLLRIAPAR